MKYFENLKDDSRVIGMLIEKNIISEEEYKKMLDALPDEADKLEELTLKDK
ncbi:hypothetical protein JXR93_10975 [bacterium]|nr:hypothetical protein [bacterium]